MFSSLRKQSVRSLNKTIQTCRYSQSPKVIKNVTPASMKRGTGGRSSFNGTVCTIFGSTGFFGRHVINRLGRTGTQMVIPYRGDHYDCMHLKPLGDLGQIIFHPFDIRDEDSIRRCVKYSNVVINLVGREYETKNFSFDDVHVKGARTLARICKESGVERFIHLSCLNANPDPKPIILKKPSRYFTSKWEGELAVRQEFPEATIIRPADVYGQEDRFLMLYHNRWRHHLIHGVPLYKKGEVTEKQPVWIGDVAAGIVAAMRDPESSGRTYQFVGPRRYKLADLVDWFMRILRREADTAMFRRLDIDYCPLFKLKVAITERLSPAYPLGYLSWQYLEREHTTDNIVKGVPKLEDLGINPTVIDTQVLWELSPWRYDLSSQKYYELFEDPPPPAHITNATV
ncbi:NADH dehydrogenase [ubiquinone] 1 alpha subcomplex subunit 9, mitochondrial [Leptopilina heterotoma]|uniref:NADH dehydrogenase [ubiquinone] 1 alpha subcomplex subunit 9, mitochondrial n=1 Tax=Leptopilina heterotoma TaxID=63436 RepID=UPI001CA95487|nr:NADH dehydrogenase [ubiquinone] 1 alpha subcomplex subunit 9, mitochondrial [Leptopilina heterotoma]